jgi:hypothetical protein
MSNAVQLATLDDLHAKCWEAGDFTPYLHAKQLEAWELLWRWWQLDPTEQTQGQYARIFGLEWGRRVGKSALCTWALSRLGILLPPLIGRPAKLRYTTMFQHSIDTIVGEVLRDVFRHAPASCQPMYHGKRGVQPAGLYFPLYGPMQGSYIAMAGLDKNPHALRGQGCDGEVISEAGFIDDLEEMIEGVLYAQYQGRDWARMILETSAPDRLHTAWELKFLPDCKLRSAHHRATLDDNPRLAPKVREEFIRAAGGRGAVRCEREYYNVIAADMTLATFPELGQQHMLDEYALPKHCLTFTALDPGHRHLFAVLFAVYDPARAGVVIVDCWAESNASTERVAAIVAAREFDLFGTWPNAELARVPLLDVVDSSGRVVQRGWQTLLADDRCARHAEALHRMANTDARKRPDERPLWRVGHDYDGQLSWYDHTEQRFKTNPAGRVSDIEPQMIHDMAVSYGLLIHPTTKADLRDTMVWFVRQWMTRGRVAFTKRAQLAYDHVKACVWNKQRTAFDEHPTYGHFDLAAALVYLCRYVDMFANINPEPPEHLGTGGPDWVGAPKWQQTDALPLSEMF